MKDDIFFDCLKHYEKGKEGKKYWGKLAKKHGYKDGETLRVKFKNERNKRNIPSKKAVKLSDYRSSQELRGDGTVVSDRLIEMSLEESRSPKRMLELHNLDPELFSLVHVKNHLWHMQKSHKIGGGLLLHYQSKITAKPKSFALDKETIDKFFKSLEVKTFKCNKPMQYEPGAEWLIVPIADFHLGLTALKNLTRNEWNMELAEQIFIEIIQQVKHKAKGRKFGGVLFIVGNDFLNSDNLSGSTTKGTPQDTWNSYYTMYAKGAELLTLGVNELLKIAPVKVVNVKSNHDMQSMYTLMLLLETMFKGNKDVEIDTDAYDRKYVVLGKSLIGLTHDITLKRALQVMTVEAKEEYAKCDNFYWFIAHKHEQMIFAKQGKLITIRLGTVSGTSSWSSSKHFIQADRENQIFVFDEKRGKSETHDLFF